MVSNFIQLAKNEKQQFIKLIVVFSLALYVLLIGWNKISNSDTYHLFSVVYTNFTVKIITGFSDISNVEIEYNAGTQLLSLSSKFTKLIMPVESYKYFFTGFILLLLVPIKHWISSLSAIIFAFLFIALRAAIISYIFLLHKGTLHNVLLVWVDPIIFVPMLILGLYIVQNTTFLSLIYADIEKRFSEILNVSFSSLLFLLIVIPTLPRVILTYIHSDIMPGIVSFILYISQFFMHLIGKPTEVTGRFITCGRSCIDLEYPCLGLGVFSLVAVLILAIKGKLITKIIYLITFAIVYLVLNALRLSALLLYLHLTPKEKLLDYVTLHDIITYFMYLVAFGGFLGYWLILNSNNNKNVR
jgi:exosortase/archaeosortase family protein